MDYVKRRQILSGQAHGVGLHEREWEPRLWRMVYAYDFEASPVVAQSRPTGTTEQVQQPGATHTVTSANWTRAPSAVRLPGSPRPALSFLASRVFRSKPPR